MKTNRWTLLIAAILIGFSLNAEAQKGKKRKKMLQEQEEAQQKATSSEMFRVSQVSSSKDPEDRTKLKDFFEQITLEFNTAAAAEFQAAQETYAGQQLKIMKRLKEKDDHGQLYLAAYDGDFAVLSLKNAELKEGDLTQPLEVEEAGNFTTKVTRQQIQKKDGDGKPSKSKPITFFGMAILDPDEVAVDVEVSEKLSKYRGVVSTEVLSEAQTMDKGLFLSTLKNGETFTVVRDEMRRCKNCGGFARIPWDGIGNRPSDGKSPCPECAEVGKKLWSVTYTVGW